MADNTTPTPATDPGLLAAQAKAGQAGVDAYNAAIAALQQQRQAATQAAMAAATGRGTPSAAFDALVPGMTAPTDTRIQSLTQGLARYQGDMAARDARLSDYNAAVNSARSLIPGQVAIATAPIKAQSDFAVSQINAEGRAKVDEIEANKRLAEIKAALAAASRGGGGGGGGGKGSGGTKLTGEKLQSNLVAGAQARLGQQGERVVQAANAAPSGADAANANAGANYAGKSAALWNAQHEAGASPVVEVPAEQTGKGTGNIFSRLALGAQQGLKSIADQAARMQSPTSRVTKPMHAPNVYDPGYYTEQPDNTAADNVSRLQAISQALGLSMRHLQMATAPKIATYQQTIGGKPQLAADTRITSKGRGTNTAPFTGPVDPREAATAAFKALLPGRDNIPEFMSYGGQSSGSREGILSGFENDQDNPQYLQDLMVAAADDLTQQGFKIDPADLPGALGLGTSYKPGMTANELAAAIAGTPGRQKAADEAATKTDKDTTATNKAAEDAAEQEFGRVTGLKFTDVTGAPDVLYTVATDPTFASKREEMFNAVGTEDTATIRKWVNDNVSDPVMRRILIAMGTTAGLGASG